MNSAEFEDISKKHEEEKKLFDSSLERIREANVFGVSQTNDIHALGVAYFSAFEKYLAKCSASGLNTAQLTDVVISIENVLKGAVDFWNTLRFLAANNSLDISLSDNFLATAQSALSKHNKSAAKKIKATYIQENLPITGFMSKKINLKEQKTDWPVALGGMVLLVISIGLAFGLGVKDGAQYLISRVVISLAAGLILSGFTKNHIQIDYKHKGAAITAIGAAAVFVIIYFFNPAEIPKIN